MQIHCNELYFICDRIHDQNLIMTGYFSKMTKMTNRKRNPVTQILYNELYLSLSELAYPVKYNAYEDIVQS